MTYISVRNWRTFQHYHTEKRQPKWIKLYTELLSDDAWLELTGHDRAVLVCLWLEYASSRCRLRLDTRSLTRQLGLRVTMASLERLNHAGYIDFVASKTLADGYQSATPEVEVEVEKEPTYLPTVVRGDEPVGREAETYEPEHPENLPPELNVENILKGMPVDWKIGVQPV